MTIIIASSPQAVNWFTFVVLLSKTARRARGFGPALGILFREPMAPFAMLFVVVLLSSLMLASQ